MAGAAPAFRDRPRGTQTLPDLLHLAARQWPDRTALVFDPGGDALAFAELQRLVHQLAAGLDALGVAAGDRVAVMLPNVAEFPVAWLATVHLGAVAVPVNTRLGATDLHGVLAHAEPGVAVVAADHVDAVRAAAPELTLVVVGEHAADGRRVHGWHQLLAAGRPQPPAAAVPETVANIQYTSGSTGEPKGCMLSHAYWVEIARTMARHGPRIDDSDVLLTAQPFTYMDPQWNLATALGTGSRLVVADRFHPARFWPTVQRHGVTYFYCLGVMPSLLLRTEPVAGEHRSSVRYAACSAIPADRHAELERRFGAPWHELYGSTETGVDLMIGPDEHDAAVGTGAMGRPVPNREVRIVDVETGEPVPRGQVGKLLVRGSYQSDGYFRDPDATARAFARSWYDTGDLARQDDGGYVHFEARTKDIIRRSGENVAAVQVEQVLEQHPLVDLAACVPVPDEIRGEEIKAYVVGPPDPTADQLDDLIGHMSQNLAYFKVPRYWEFRTELPLTSSEKVAKHRLRTEPGARPCFDRVAGSWNRAG